MEAKRQDLMNSLGLLVIRVVLAAFMMTHGWGKVEMVFAGNFEQFADPIGLGKPLSLILAAGAEFVCAFLVLIGAATRLAAAPLVFTMLIAAFVAHFSDPLTSGEAARLFFSGATKYPAAKQPALMFAAVFFGLIFTGAGKFSVDGMVWPIIKERRARRKAAGK